MLHLKCMLLQYMVITILFLLTGAIGGVVGGGVCGAVILVLLVVVAIGIISWNSRLYCI